MIYKVTQITADVLTALDMNDVSRPLLALPDIDTLTVEKLVRSKVEDGVRSVETECPLYMLHPGHAFADSLCWEHGNWGWTLLPDDFMRLVAFRMSDWETTVYQAISQEDPQYTLQKGRWQGLRGTAQRPVCAIVPRPEGLALEFYSCLDRTATVEQATYRPYPTVCAGGIDISPRCYRAAVYHIAGLAAQGLGRQDGASFFELSKSVMT